MAAVDHLNNVFAIHEKLALIRKRVRHRIEQETAIREEDLVFDCRVRVHETHLKHLPVRCAKHVANGASGRERSALLLTVGARCEPHIDGFGGWRRAGRLA